MKYQNISSSDQNLIGFGVIPAGGTIETYEVIENPNFTAIETTPTPVPTPPAAPVVAAPEAPVQESNPPTNS